MATDRVHHGVVVSFDDHAGLGEIASGPDVTHPFHCTALADGTRTIEVRTEVMFRVVAGRAGRWEATQVTRVAGEVAGQG